MRKALLIAGIILIWSQSASATEQAPGVKPIQPEWVETVPGQLAISQDWYEHGDYDKACKHLRNAYWKAQSRHRQMVPDIRRMMDQVCSMTP